MVRRNFVLVTQRDSGIMNNKIFFNSIQFQFRNQIFLSLVSHLFCYHSKVTRPSPHGNSILDTQTIENQGSSIENQESRIQKFEEQFNSSKKNNSQRQSP